MSQGPPPQLKEFIRRAGVNVQQSEQVRRLGAAGPAAAAAMKVPLRKNIENVGEFAEFLNDENLLNVVSEKLAPTPLKLTNFIAEVSPVVRPNVLNFVRKTTPLRTNGGLYDVQEITGYYGQFQKGVTHTNLYGFQVHQNLEPSELKNKTWSFIEFRVVVAGKSVVLVRLYDGKMMIQGGIANNDPETPLKVAKHIASKYLGQNSADMNMKFVTLDGSFKFNATFSPEQVAEKLKNKNIQFEWEPELHLTELRNIKYKGVVIDSITKFGVVNIKNRTSVSEIKKVYEVAKSFVRRMDERKLLDVGSNYAPDKVTKIPSPKKVRVPRVEKLRNKTNVLLNGELCSKYKLSTLKDICKAMGIFAKKEWKKVDYCRAIFDKNVENTLTNNKKNNKKNKNNLYKKRGINNASIRNMLKKEKSTNVNANLKSVKNRFNKVAANKKGVPFKKGVQNAVKDVVKERKIEAYAKGVVNRYKNINANARRVILNRVKSAKPKTQQAVNSAVRRDVAIARLDVNAPMKNKIYNDLKNKSNINVNTYARLYKLIDDYAMVSRRRAEVKKMAHNWLRNKQQLPTNDAVKRKLVQIIRNYDNSLFNLNLMEKLYKERQKRRQ